MKVYYTIPTVVSYSNEKAFGQGTFDYRIEEYDKIIKILQCYYDINKEVLPEDKKEMIENLLDSYGSLMLEEKEFNLIAPILEKFLYNDGIIKEGQIVGLLLDDCFDLNYLTLTSDYAYSFEAGMIRENVVKKYIFSKYKNIICPAVWHIYNGFSTDYTIVYEEDDNP